MKHFFISFLILFAATASLKAGTPLCGNDTIVKVLKPDSIVIVENDSVSTFHVFGATENPQYSFTYSKSFSNAANTSISEHGTNWDFDYPFKKKNKSDIDRNKVGIGGNIFLGFLNTLGAPSNMNVKMFSSIELGMDFLYFRHNSANGKYSFTTGLICTERFYRMTGRSRFVKADDGTIIAVPYPSETSDIKASLLRVASLGIPFRFGYRFAKHMEFGLGAHLNVNLNGDIRNKYKVKHISEENYMNATFNVKETYKGVKTNRVSVDLRATLKWKGFGIYTQYSPCSVLNTTYGPSFTPISVGIIL